MNAEISAMQQITCSNELPGGTRCGETAKLVSTQFVYRQEFIEGQFDQILSEIHYNINCPKCGQYTLVTTGNSVEDTPGGAEKNPGRSANNIEQRKRQLNGQNGGRP